MQIKRDDDNREKEQDVKQYLTFVIGGEEYAISLLRVKEIIEYDTVTEVPKTPEWGPWGYQSARKRGSGHRPSGEVQASRQHCRKTYLHRDHRSGMRRRSYRHGMADAVRQVIDLKPQDIEVPPTFGTRVKVDYLLGMARSGKKFCLILDTEKVLSTDELLELPDRAEELASGTDLPLTEAPPADSQASVEVNPE